MEEKKNNKGLIWLIVILIILVLGLVGYIVYDKLVLENTKEKNTISTTTTTIESEKIKNKFTLNNFPTVNDNNVIVYGDIFDIAKENLIEEQFKIFEKWTDFENLTFTINNNNNNFNLSCNEYNTEYETCFSKKVMINDNIELFFSDYADYTGLYLLITDKYYVTQSGNDIGTGNISIYDRQGKLVKEIPDIVYNYYYEENIIQSQIKIVDKKLYYVVDENCNFVLKYLDLENNFKDYTIENFNAEGQGWC